MPCPLYKLLSQAGSSKKERQRERGKSQVKDSKHGEKHTVKSKQRLGKKKQTDN